MRGLPAPEPLALPSKQCRKGPGVSQGAQLVERRGLRLGLGGTAKEGRDRGEGAGSPPTPVSSLDSEERRVEGGDH